MYRSVAVEARHKKGAKRNAPTEESLFLKALSADLSRFGRADTVFAEVGNLAIFAWSTLYNQAASPEFRKEVAKCRLAANASTLKEFEASHAQLFRRTFTVDTHKINPEILPCGDDAELNAIFEYYLFQQSIESSVNRGRYGRFIVYDTSVAAKPIIGIIGLSSPLYFNGARDAVLGWMPPGHREGHDWIKDQGAQEIRDHGLLSLSHITVATLVPPYNDRNLKLGRLLTTLCFSDAVVGFMENTYKRPIAALTTTGGWGGSAGPYQRIRLRQSPSGMTHLFFPVPTKEPSLNRSIRYFSSSVFRAALDVHRVSSPESSNQYKDFAQDESVRRRLFGWILHHLSLPRSAAYVNRVSHYVGAVSDAGIEYLRKGAKGRPPTLRTIPVETALRYWRDHNGRARLVKVRPTPLSELSV